MHGLQEKVNCIFPLSDSIFLLGRDRDVLVLNRYTLENSAVLKMANADIPDPKNVYRIFNSSHGLIAVAENGIFVLSNNLITDYYGIDSKRQERHLPISYILDACEDDFKNLWLGTNGQGLIKWEWNRSSSALTHYSTKEGLPSMIVYRIEQDNFGNIWSSSDDGIFSLNLNSNIVRAFKIEDGLPSNEFNRTSSFKSALGDIYFGSVNGLVALSPGDFSARENTNSAPLKLVRIVKRTRGNDNEIEILNAFNALGKINWESSDFLLEMEFALLDFRGYKISYSYRIPGVVNEWVKMEQNSLTLGSLPTGVFNIEVRAQLDNGEIVSQSLVIPIEVYPPFYLKTSFVVSTATTAVLVILLFIWLRGRKLRSRNLRLERLVAEKTEDLMKSLEDKDILLKELHHRVKNNLQIIISLFDLQKEQLKDPSAIDAINESQTRLSSIALIHQNFYNTSNLEEINFHTFLNELTIATRVSFGCNEEDVFYTLSSKEINVAIESAIPLGLLINELLTNSFKHIQSEYYPLKITINLVEVSALEYELSYIDNGPGLPQGIVLNKPNSLGLKLVKGLTTQLKGSLTYSNVEGSKFLIRFPKKRKLK
jgi:two-component sensor histidine kinase